MNPDPAQMPSLIHDVRLPHRSRALFWARIVGVAFISMVAFTAIITIIWALTDAPYIGMITAVVAVSGVWFFMLRNSRRAARALADRIYLDALAYESEQRWTELTVGLEADFLSMLSDRLAKERRWGEVYRLQDSDDFADVAPIDVPFEPIPLNHAAAAEFIANDPPAAGQNPDAPDATSKNLLRRTLRRLRSDPRVVMIFPLIIFVEKLSKSISTGQMDWMLLVWGAALSLLLVASLFRKHARDEQRYLVPGGLAYRKVGDKPDGWRLELFEREKSSLLAWLNNDSQWFVWIKSEYNAISFSVPDKQCIQLLRAWLSPLDPPALDQLSDLK